MKMSLFNIGEIITKAEKQFVDPVAAKFVHDVGSVYSYCFRADK